MSAEATVVADFGVVPVVEVSGPDARRFANGMFTNNVRDLPSGRSQRTGLTDDRGRLWALAELHAVREDAFWLVLDGQTVEAFVERYDKYVVFDDVELIPHPGMRLFTVQGPAAAERLGFDLPAAGTHTHIEGGLCIGRDRGAGGGDLLVSGEAAEEWVERLHPDVDGGERVNAMRILARQPTMADVVRPGLPHEHGLRDAILHFEKGCYLGQESIHRIDVMGNPRRALTLLKGDVALGDVVDANGKVAGTVTSLCEHPDGAKVGMAVVRKPHDKAGAVLVSATGASVESIG